MTRALPIVSFSTPARRERGSVLIIVMWTCLGLVALTLYFAGSMSSALRAADNRVAEIAARESLRIRRATLPAAHQHVSDSEARVRCLERTGR
jgi:hypothetical protein